MCCFGELIFLKLERTLASRGQAKEELLLDIICLKTFSNHMFLGCFLQAVITAGVFKCFGIMYVAFMEEFDSKAGDAAWIITISSCFLQFGGTF